VLGSISDVALSRAGPKGRLLRILGVSFGIAVIVGETIGSGILRTPGGKARIRSCRSVRVSLFVCLESHAAGASAAIQNVGIPVDQPGHLSCLSRIPHCVRSG
jgi:hypothetical protein